MTPDEIYGMLRNYSRHDSYTGSCPNNTWGCGKINIDSAFASSVFVNEKIFLEGSFNTSGDTMATVFRTQGLVPLTSPYPDDSRTVLSVPQNIVDWILVQLRSTANGSVVASRSAFLRRDGRIVADDGSTTRITLDVPSGSYYLVLKHRNHLSVMGLNSILLNNDQSTLYDFTLNSNLFYGTGGAKELEPGIWGMIAGDADYSGSIGASDRNLTWNNRTLIGYINSDCDLSSTVGASDRNITWNNRTKITTVP